MSLNSHTFESTGAACGYETLFVQPDADLRNILATIDRGACGIALVVDEDQHLLGTLTDGDVRRAILADMEMSTSAEQLLQRKSGTFYARPVTASPRTATARLRTLMDRHHVQQIPIVEQGRVVALVRREQLDRIQSSPATAADLNLHGSTTGAEASERGAMQAMIMAGGYGKRLLPLTRSTPKPMLPVGDKPVLGHCLERLHQAGIEQVHIATHYMPEKIESFVGDGSRFGVQADYVYEDEPLGTAGALSLIDRPTQPTLVINGDILTRVDFRALLAFHREQRALLTVGVRRYSFTVPYGVVRCDDSTVRAIEEKPDVKLMVNAGIYLLEPDVWDHIEPAQRLDMTQLIHRLIESDRDGSGAVASFPVVEYWTDIGQHDDYEQAQRDIAEIQLTQHPQTQHPGNTQLGSDADPDSAEQPQTSNNEEGGVAA